MSGRLVAAAALVDDLDRPSRLLCGRRRRPLALAGRWELPGGKAEPGESPAAALCRELAEELAISVRIGAELRPPSGTTWPLTPGLVMRVWWCVVTAGLPRAGDAHTEVRWVEADGLDGLAWLEPDRPVVRLIAARLSEPSRARAATDDCA